MPFERLDPEPELLRPRRTHLLELRPRILCAQLRQQIFIALAELEETQAASRRRDHHASHRRFHGHV
jgi:hypothetical protein